MPVVSLRDCSPEPVPFVVEGLVPADAYVSLLFGVPGSQKSFVALWMATCVATGLDVFGRRVLMPGPVLWIDSEQSRRVMTQRAWMVARGCGLDAPPEGLLYLRLDSPLTDASSARKCGDAIREHAPALVVLDSIGEAADVDPQDSKGIKRVIRTMRSWGVPVLAIDHVAMSSKGRSSGRPIGSGAKDAAMRSGIYVSARNDMVTLRPTKANYGELQPPMTLRATFTDDTYSLTPASSSAADRSQRAGSSADRILSLISQPASVEAVATGAGIARRTAMNRLGELRAQGRAERTGEGLWHRTER